MPVLPCCPLSQPAHPAPLGRAAARAASAREPPRIATLSPVPASAPRATTGHPASWVRPLRPAPCFVGSLWGWTRLPRGCSEVLCWFSFAPRCTGAAAVPSTSPCGAFLVTPVLCSRPARHGCDCFCLCRVPRGLVRAQLQAAVRVPEWSQV